MFLGRKIWYPTLSLAEEREKGGEGRGGRDSPDTKLKDRAFVVIAVVFN